jgi:hypothetical protein
MQTLDIILSQRVVTVQPVPRAVLSALEKAMLAIQEIWIEEAFSTADAIARSDCWGHMKTVAGMLPLAENPAVQGLDLELLSNDYEQLERLFFGDISGAYQRDYGDQEIAIAQIDISQFKGCDIWQLHRFEPKKKLMQANDLRREKSPPLPSEPKTSRSKTAATKKRTRSPISSTDSAQQQA